MNDNNYILGYLSDGRYRYMSALYHDDGPKPCSRVNDNPNHALAFDKGAAVALASYLSGAERPYRVMRVDVTMVDEAEEAEA
jgi:hypothetical protein